MPERASSGAMSSKANETMQDEKNKQYDTDMLVLRESQQAALDELVKDLQKKAAVNSNDQDSERIDAVESKSIYQPKKALGAISVNGGFVHANKSEGGLRQEDQQPSNMGEQFPSMQNISAIVAATPNQQNCFHHGIGGGMQAQVSASELSHARPAKSVIVQTREPLQGRSESNAAANDQVDEEVLNEIITQSQLHVLQENATNLSVTQIHQHQQASNESSNMREEQISQTVSSKVDS